MAGKNEKSVKFTKDHDTHKNGDVVDLPNGLANYLIGCNVVIEHKEAKEPAKRQNKEDKTAKSRETK